MTSAVHREVPKSDKRSNRRLAFGVFAAPIAWFFHEIVSLSIVGRNCVQGGDISQGGNLATWQWAVLVLLPVLTALTALAAIVVSFGMFRSHNPEAKLTGAEGWSRVEFIALFGTFVSSFLLLNIIYFGVMPFVVDPCVRAI